LDQREQFSWDGAQGEHVIDGSEFNRFSGHALIPAAPWRPVPVSMSPGEEQGSVHTVWPLYS